MTVLLTHRACRASGGHSTIKTMKRERVLELIDGIYKGESLASLTLDYKERRAFFELIQTDIPLQELYTAAQKTRAEIYADEIISIADNSDEDAQRAKNRIDARKWYASKINSKKYGDRIDIGITHTVDLSQALTDARSRLKDIPAHIESPARVTETHAQLALNDSPALNSTNRANASGMQAMDIPHVSVERSRAETSHNSASLDKSDRVQAGEGKGNAPDGCFMDAEPGEPWIKVTKQRKPRAKRAAKDAPE